MMLELGAMVRSESMLKPMVPKFLAHLHRAASHIETTSKEAGFSGAFI
jgi:hypothetical protein